MAGYFPKNLDVLVIGQNPGQLHKRKSGWDDSEYAFNDEDWSKFQQDYAKGLMEAPLGKWLNDGFQGRVIWGLTNIVKCRTESNLVDFEMQANCRPWLQQQLLRLKPRIILILGAQAWAWWKVLYSIDRAEGKLFYTERKYFNGLIMPLYHPAYKKYQHDKFTRQYFDKLVNVSQSKRLYTAATKLNIIATSGELIK